MLLVLPGSVGVGQALEYGHSSLLPQFLRICGTLPTDKSYCSTMQKDSKAPRLSRKGSECDPSSTILGPDGFDWALCKPGQGEVCHFVTGHVNMSRALWHTLAGSIMTTCLPCWPRDVVAHLTNLFEANEDVVSFSSLEVFRMGSFYNSATNQPPHGKKAACGRRPDASV